MPAEPSRSREHARVASSGRRAHQPHWDEEHTHYGHGVHPEAITAGGPQLEVMPVARDGRAVEQLISAAETNDAALVVVGNRRLARRGPVYGAAATRLQRRASYPVVIVPSALTA